MTGSRAGELARDADVRRLLLTHLQPWTNPEKNVTDAASVFDGDVKAVRPGDVYEV